MDWQCASDFCTNKVCRSKLSLGSPCKGADEHCKSDVCARMSSDNTIQCGPYKYETTLGYDFCGRLADGSTCKHDRQCSNGLCTQTHGRCGKIGNGDRCSGADEDCHSNVCARMTSDNTMQCCPHKYSYYGYDYCGRLAEGNSCKRHGQCSNNMECKSGRCQKKWKAGTECHMDGQCASNSCDMRRRRRFRQRRRACN